MKCALLEQKSISKINEEIQLSDGNKKLSKKSDKEHNGSATESMSK